MTTDKYRVLLVDDDHSLLRLLSMRLTAAGYAVTICFVDRGETAERAVAEALARDRYDAVMVGAGVRKDDEQFLLFEKLINVIHRHAAKAAICFNTGPTDSAAAVQRWL